MHEKGAAKGDGGSDGHRYLHAAHERGAGGMRQQRAGGTPGVASDASAPPSEPRIVCATAAGTCGRRAPCSCGPGIGSTSRFRSPPRRARHRPAGRRHWRPIRSLIHPGGPIPRRSSSRSAATGLLRDRSGAGRAPRPDSSWRPPIRRDLPQATGDRARPAATVSLSPTTRARNGEASALATSMAAIGRMLNPAWIGEKPRSNCRNWVCRNNAPSRPNTPRHSAAAATENRRSKEVQIQHRMTAAGLPADERPENDKARQPDSDHLRDAQPRVGASMIAHSSKPRPAMDNSAPRIGPGGGRVLRVGHEHQCSREPGNHDRDVDEKH